jgi:DNA processing protein
MIETSAKTAILLAYGMIKGVGPSTLRKIAALPGFERRGFDEVALQVPALAKAARGDGVWERALALAGEQLDQAERYQAKILSTLDDAYPQLLATTKDDPVLLFVRGRLSPYPQQSVAVIGTRQPTLHGQHCAARLTQYFAEREWSIVSGLAIGCDTIAHSSAVELGAHTVAVLAHGLQTISPASNRKLAEKILDTGGALVSQYPFGEAAQRAYFVQRDKVQAGLARGVVMIQSDLVGGSLHASRATLEYQRPLIVPYPTEADRAQQEPKVQANILLADGEEFQKAELLRCPISTLEKVIVVKSKDEYPRLIPALMQEPVDSPAKQTALL